MAIGARSSFSFSVKHWRQQQRDMTQILTLSLVLSNTRVLKLLGLSCFSVENGKSVTKLVDVLCMLSTVALGALVCYYSVTYRNELAMEKSMIASVGNFLSYLASIVIVVLSVLITFMFRHKIWKLALTLDLIEEKFLEIGSKMDYTRMLRIYAYVCVSILLIILALECLVYYIYASAIKVILHLYASAYFSLNIGICTIIILSVTLRLRRINVVCRALLRHAGVNRTALVKVRPAEQKDETETIGKLYEIYSLCIDVCDLINLCFMFQVMMGYGLVFFFTIFTSFSVYKDLSSHGYLMPETIVAFAFCLYYNFFLILIIFMCYEAEEEAQTTLKLANEMMKRSHDMNKTLMLVTFTTLVKKRGPKFSCGLFDFDWKLVFANISSAATNFVILMQFDMASKR